jgi:predicted nucleotide-binding protein (sugar kinase/HSP70/actin superfamily)
MRIVFIYSQHDNRQLQVIDRVKEEMSAFVDEVAVMELDEAKQLSATDQQIKSLQNRAKQLTQQAKLKKAQQSVSKAQQQLTQATAPISNQQ